MKSKLKEKEEKITINEKGAEKLKRIEDLIRANTEQRKKEEDENRKKREEQSKREREERLKKMKEKQKKSEEEKRNREEEEKKRKEEEEKNKIEEKNKKFQEYQRKQKEIEQEKIKEKLIKEKEKERLLLERKNQLKELLIRQKLLRNPIISENKNNIINNNDINKESLEPKQNIDQSNSNATNNQKEQLKQTLEDMCLMGNIIKEEILEDKNANQEKYISIEEAINKIEKPNPNKDDKAMFCLALLAQNLEHCGITTAIEKQKEDDDINKENEEESSTSLQFIVNGLINKFKYEFSFDLGEERNNNLLNNKEQQEAFNNNLRKKLSLDYNIPEDKIIITCPQKGSYKVYVIFISEDFDLNPEQFKNSCTNDEEFKELCYLKEIQKKVIMEGVKLAPNMLDYRGNQTPDGYGRGQKRGTYDYIPPLGWKGFGLKVLGKYDNGNDDWIKMDNNPNEWAIAYHGIGRGRNDVEDITRKIATEEYQKLIKGANQSLKDFDDDNHPGKKIGEGVYCSNDIGYIEKWNLCGNSNTQINGKKYKMAFMLRVKPDRIRVNKNYPNEWILDGTTDEMRPYRILLKEV